MAKIARYSGNVQAFGSAALGTERTIFGSASQSDTLTANMVASFFRGWKAGVNPDGYPTEQWFNAIGFVATQLSAYLHQVGVAEWDAAQEYDTNSYCNYGGVLYKSLIDSNVGVTPGTDPTKWQNILGGYATLDSPHFSGDPTTPTPATNDVSTTVINSQFLANVLTAAGYAKVLKGIYIVPADGSFQQTITIPGAPAGSSCFVELANSIPHDVAPNYAVTGVGSFGGSISFTTQNPAPANYRYNWVLFL